MKLRETLPLSYPDICDLTITQNYCNIDLTFLFYHTTFEVVIEVKQSHILDNKA
jgi:hypothetical protein